MIRRSRGALERMSMETEEIPGYERGETVHDSAASIVHRARRVADGARVVIKRSRGPSVSVRQLTRYRNELELLTSLDCAGVVKALDLVRHDGRIALVLEEVPGTSLRQWLVAHPRAPLAERVAIGVQLAAIVADVHAAKVIHKDISSHNILYDATTRRCKLIDFGIATRLRSEENKFLAPAALEGTLAYIAPEQTGRMNRSLDYRADLYSLGVTLYELLTGSLPHETADPLEMVHFHIAGKPTPPHERVNDVPLALSNVVMKLLQKEPENRYQSAAGLRADLGICLTALEAGRAVLPFVLGAEDAVDRFEPPGRLYGRGAETEVLLRSFETAARGSVEAVLVAGPAGIGKTSLVQEIHQPITRRRGYFVAGKFDQLQQNVPFSALVAALQDLVEQLLTESEEAIEAWRRAIQAALGPNGQLLIDVLPALELIIGQQPRVPDLEPLEAQNRFNLVFQSFVQVFCKRAHPLVLFLDDMQWADAASLNLVTLIASARATESLLLVMTYRDNEVSATHPFMLAVSEQAKQGLQIHSMTLRPLTAPQVAEFVADALRQDIDTATPLAAIIAQKTGGNPFFMRQFLRALHDSKLIYFDAPSRAFKYDAGAVRDAAITENVAELLAAKLDKLPRATRDVLRVAAAIGNRFDLQVLAGVDQRSPAETAAHLEHALHAGLIVPLSGLESLDGDALDAPLIYSRFAFLHDRVQQAAYATLADADKPALHLAIGRVLLGKVSAAQLDNRLFDVVNHLNQGIPLIVAPAERLQLAELNGRAGVRARDATAYDLAVRCLRRAVELLGEDAWESRYELVCELHKRLAETLALVADYDAAFAVLDGALARATSLIDRANLCTIKTNVLLLMGQIPAALACGRDAARMFAVDLPEEREQVRALLQTEIETILARTAEIGIERLLERPVMTDQGSVALMALLTHCLPAAYQYDQDSYALLTCTMVRLSLDHGNCPLSARAYGSFAALIVSALRNYRDGYRFAKLGVDLAHKLADPSVLSGVYFLWAMFASHWVKPIDESIELYRKSIQFGMQSGDHLHTGYSIARRFSHLQYRGASLPELVDEGGAALELLARIGDPTNVQFIEPRLRLIHWLRGERHYGNTLGSAERDEAAWTAIITARGNRSFEHDWLRLLAMQRYHAGAFEEAYDLARASNELLPYSAGFVTRGEQSLFLALAITAIYGTADPARRATLDAELVANRALLREWAAGCPENYGHLHLLVEAESARIHGARIEAADLYDRAIHAARDEGFINVEALAAELAARFWFADNKPDFGRLYLEKALHGYEIWGAQGKVADLRAQHGLVPPRAAASPTSAGSTTLGSSPERGDALDLATVLKSSQAIAGEIVLERLLGTLLSIIIENAGAESVALILDSDGEFLLQGTKKAGAEARVLMGEPLRQSVAVSKGIVNYVIRTSEHVVLADPALGGKFRNDPYVRNRHPKSVLCAPLAHKGKLIGIVYLENNQIAGAFTPDRLEALNILASQIAVSIENATLYAKQEQQSRTIEAANVTLTTEIAERKRAEHELSRYKDHLEELVKERTRELESAQGRLVEMSRRAGMAEVASGVLHNVGNVMNSVNVGASVSRDSVKHLPVEGVARACELLDANADRLAEYLRSDAMGRKLPQYLRKLGETLSEHKRSILVQLDQLMTHLEHMKKIIAAQQSYAKVNGVTELCALEEIAEAALALSEGVLRNQSIEIVRNYEKLPPVLVDRHQIMQILVNLISNAKHALEASDNAPRRLTVDIAKVKGGIRIEVHDNGIGIARDNLAKIFNHGFTTKKQGHGFGLHNCANAAQQMDGSLTAYSEGPGKGASFVLRLPLVNVDSQQAWTETGAA
jgi:predicted ATPase/signal transduction histidine kinase/tRNA A-37 threonylcarbamoyl transferase component Bud32